MSAQIGIGVKILIWICGDNITRRPALYACSSQRTVDDADGTTQGFGQADTKEIADGTKVTSGFG